MQFFVRGKVIEGLTHRHIQYFVDILAFVFNAQGLLIKTLAVANFAGDINVGEKVHFHLAHTVTLAGFAAAAFHIKENDPGRNPCVWPLWFARKYCVLRRECALV